MSEGRRIAGGFALVLKLGPGLLAGAFLVALAGCESIEDRYKRRPPISPTPVGATEETSAGDPISGPAGQPVRVRTGAAANPLSQPEFYTTGDGVPTPARQAEPVALAPGPPVTLNFVDTDIREVVHVVFSETLGLNYVIDQRVSGTVTARTNAPIPRRDVLGVVQNVLAGSGAGFYADGGVYYVAPLDALPSLPQLSADAGRAASARGIGTHVIPVLNGSAVSIHKVASEIVSDSSKLALDEDREVLIFTGAAEEARAVSDLVATLDTDALSGLSFALVPVRSTAAEEIADEMAILVGEGVVGGVGRQVRFLAIDRLNAVLVVTRRAEHLRPLAAWIRRLDRSNPSAVRQAFVYQVRNGKARELSEVLADIFGTEQLRGQTTGPRRTPSPADARPIGTPLSERPVDTSARADEAAADELTSGIENALAEVEGGLDRRGGDATGLRFVPHEAKNAIVVMATAEEFKQVERILARIDRPPVQVFIEATILEVSLTDNLEYGVQWAFENGDLSMTLSSAARGAVAPAFPGFNAIIETPDIRVVLSALSAVTDVEVLSSPQLMVLNNQTARLQIGDQVPVATQTSTSVTDPEAPIVNTVGYFDTGVILEVTPRVSEDGSVMLETALEVSDAVATSSSAIDSPTIQQRALATNVLIRSGQTVALGGLISGSARGTVNGIPVLKDIPIIGNAFKTTGQEGERNELLILLTPRIVEDAREARQVTEELRRRLAEIQGEIGRRNR